MRTSALLLTFLSVAQIEAAAEPIPDATNCRLSAPPGESGETLNHGAVFKVYPRASAISRNYTGCQSMWVASGQQWARMSLVLIEAGDPTRIWGPDGVGPDLSACRYRAGELVAGSESTCPMGQFLIQSSMPPGCVAKSQKAGRIADGCEPDAAGR